MEGQWLQDKWLGGLGVAGPVTRRAGDYRASGSEGWGLQGNGSEGQGLGGLVAWRAGGCRTGSEGWRLQDQWLREPVARRACGSEGLEL